MRLRSKALALVAKREYSRKALLDKLSSYSEDLLQINQLLDEFEQLGYISDSRYADCFINSRKFKYGKKRLAYQLQQKGISKEIIVEHLDNIDIENEVAVAHQLIVRKYGDLLLDRSTVVKAERFLLYRGFNFTVIKHALKLAIADLV
jgi:regulatory protein